MFHFEVSGQILLVAHKEEKMLPSNVVKETLETELKRLAAQQRKLKDRETILKR